MQESYEEQMKCLECAYDSLKNSHIQLEGRTMELQSQLAKASRQRQRSTRTTSGSNPTMIMATPLANRSTNSSMNSGGSSGGLVTVPAPRRGGGATASVDIELPAPVLTGLVDKTFMVGSPPSSSGGSMGSDRSELIRQGLEMGGVMNINPVGGAGGGAGDCDMMQMSDHESRSPEIGSAVSAKETYGTSAGNNSMNGSGAGKKY